MVFDIAGIGVQYKAVHFTELAQETVLLFRIVLGKHVNQVFLHAVEAITDGTGKISVKNQHVEDMVVLLRKPVGFQVKFIPGKGKE